MKQENLTGLQHRAASQCNTLHPLYQPDKWWADSDNHIKHRIHITLCICLWWMSCGGEDKWQQKIFQHLWILKVDLKKRLIGKWIQKNLIKLALHSNTIKKKSTIEISITLSHTPPHYSPQGKAQIFACRHTLRSELLLFNLPTAPTDLKESMFSCRVSKPRNNNL